MTLLFIFIATLFISALALVSAAILSLFPGFLRRSTLFLVALAAGTLLSAGLFELIPEAAEQLGLETSLWVVALTFACMLGAEKILHWHHCHDEDCENRPVGYMNLLGDGIHNFLDGMVIAAAFQIHPSLGITTTLAVALHELPQEIGDFGVLIHAGFSRGQALLANLSVALLAVAGGFVGYAVTAWSTPLAPYLIPVAAGTFLYLAAVDLIPEFRRTEDLKKSMALFTLFLVGLFGIPLVSNQLGLEHSHEHEEIQAEEHAEHGHELIEIDTDH